MTSLTIVKNVAFAGTFNETCTVEHGVVLEIKTSSLA
jgi:hypothetical protein